MPSSLVMRMRINLSRSSWPGLTRPSTSFARIAQKQDVDARHKAGHDGVLGSCSSVFLDHLFPAHIPLQHIGHCDRAALLLIRLHYGDQRAADRDAGAVKCVHEPRRAVLLAADARVHAPRLEVAAV